LQPFTLSKIAADKSYQHKRIKHLPNGAGFSIPYKGQDKTFKDITQLVQCEELGLKKPCPKIAIDFNPYREDDE
jgi:hypothetical protein